MSWIKNLFGKKEEVVVQPKEEIQQIPSPVPKEAWVCDYCKGSIDVGERWSKFQGINLKRKFIGCDLNKNYVENSNSRLTKLNKT